MLASKVCLLCGQEFTPHSAIQKYCNRDHHATCAVCGKDFIIPREKLGSKSRLVCSNECANKLRGKSALSSNCFKTCEACGKQFKPINAQQRFCNNDHYFTCVVCGKEFLCPRWKLSQVKTCSAECGAKLSHKTYHQRYGADKNPQKHAELIDKMEETMTSRYGVKNALSKQGRIQFKVEDAFKHKYGVASPGLSDEIRKKRKETALNRYGSVCPLVNPEIAAKSKATLLLKYGVDNYARSVQFLKQVITEPDKADECKAFREDPRNYILTNFSDHNPTIRELSIKCGIRESSVGSILDSAGCQDIISFTYSRMEDELYEFLISELGADATIERNTFKIITPYELDLYLPEHKFAIECNPTITHNSTVPGWGTNDEPKSTIYHKMKTDLCEKQGIFLYHIFGYDWSWHSDIIKSMIRNVLHTTPNIIYARKTKISEVTDSVAMNFLNKNHRQGGAHSKIRLGLFYDEELVSLMTFSKMRLTIGAGKHIESNCFELVRFCNKINTNVVGGASKLFKHFIGEYQPKEIRSFSDRAHTRGSLYSMLGFQYDHTSDPGYMWVDVKTDKGFARNNAQKQNIKKFLHDDDIDLNKTEVQIMKEHNFVQVFDSGINLWVWRKEST